MKKNYLLGGVLGLIAVALVVTVFTFSSSPTGSSTLKGTFSSQIFRNQGLELNASRIAFEPTVHGDRSFIPVTLRNPTNEAINISWQQRPVDPAFTMVGVPAMLAANASQVVNFVFSPVDRDARSHTSQIMFIANGTPKILTMTGQAISPYRVLQDASLPVDFGEIYAGTSNERNFAVVNQSNHAIHFNWSGLPRFRDDNGQIRRDLTKGFGVPLGDFDGFDVPAHGSYVATVFFMPTTLPNYSMDVSLNGDGFATNFHLVGRSRSPFMVSPTTVNFSPTAVGNTSFATFTVRNISDRAIQIDLQPVVLMHDLRIANETEFTIQPSQEHVVAMSFAPRRANAVYDQRAGALVHFNAASLTADIMINATSTPR